MDHNHNKSYQNHFDDSHSLHSRVSTLKQIAIEIDGELASQRGMLLDMVNMRLEIGFFMYESLE